MLSSYLRHHGFWERCPFHSSSPWRPDLQWEKFKEAMVKTWPSVMDLFLRCVFSIVMCTCKSQRGFLGSASGKVVKNLPVNAGDLRDAGSIPGSGRSPAGGHGNPLQYCRPENLMDRGTWWATVHRLVQSQTRLKQLNTHACKSQRHSTQNTGDSPIQGRGSTFSSFFTFFTNQPAEPHEGLGRGHPLC